MEESRMLARCSIFLSILTSQTWQQKSCCATPNVHTAKPIGAMSGDVASSQSQQKKHSRSAIGWRYVWISLRTFWSTHVYQAFHSNPANSQPTLYAQNIPTVAYTVPPNDEHIPVCARNMYRLLILSNWKQTVHLDGPIILMDTTAFLPNSSALPRRPYSSNDPYPFILHRY
jgi:hypothetical protein